MHWLLLAVGIAIELLATTALELSDGFTRLGYAGLTLLCFGLAFYVMSLVVRTMPVAVAYLIFQKKVTEAVMISSGVKG